MYSSKRRKSGKGKNERKTSVLKRKRTGKNKKTYPEVTGKVQMTREGFIYVIIEGENDDVFVRAGKTKGSLNGDIVRVSVTKEDFPEPETPVTRVSVPSSILTVTPLRLFADAPVILIAPRPGLRRFSGSLI